MDYDADAAAPDVSTYPRGDPLDPNASADDDFDIPAAPASSSQLPPPPTDTFGRIPRAPSPVPDPPPTPPATYYDFPCGKELPLPPDSALATLRHSVGWSWDRACLRCRRYDPITTDRHG